MTIKEFLSQGYRLNEEIDCKIEQLNKLNALARKANSSLTGMPHGAGGEGSALENVIVKIVDLQNEINADIDRLVDMKKEIGRLISSVENSDQRLILQLRYLCWEKWQDIVVKMNLSKPQVYAIHAQAMEALKKFF